MNKILLDHLIDPANGWSIGSFGAIGEFFHDPGEELNIVPSGDNLCIATPRGGLRIYLNDKICPIAYERLRRHRDRWGQALALCLPEEQALCSQRDLITELSYDKASIQECHRDHILFDLGLNLKHVDLCVRTNDKSLITLLRAAIGTNLFAPKNSVMMEIIKNNPHRVFISKLGRVEVYQRIGVEKSPEGPHTHVLPKLLKLGKTHDSNTPIPEGYLCCLHLHPANPLVDTLGRERSFEINHHINFQNLLRKWGLPEYLSEKDRILEAYSSEIVPEDFSINFNRLSQVASRVGLRQLLHTEGQSEKLDRWRNCIDRKDSILDEVEA